MGAISSGGEGSVQTRSKGRQKPNECHIIKSESVTISIMQYGLCLTTRGARSHGTGI